MPKETIDTTNKLIKPEDISPSDDEVIRQLSENLQDVTLGDIDDMCDEMEEVEKRKEEEKENGKLSQEKKEKLYGKKEEILKNLKENYIKIEENVEMMGYEGKKVHINLPAVGNFEGFKFDYFVSNNTITKGIFERTSELENKSYSMKEVGELLKAMNRYMKAMGVETDGEMNYEKDLRYWETYNYSCIAGDCLKDITGLSRWYWLTDKDVAGRNGSRARWSCGRDRCSFSRRGNGYRAHLFLRLSD